ncbi:P-loop containing nucleoside triphosphate hydrolase protein [Limtongia smithiae]|uniref:P-loop containing nucleoside triphosphate hydrolase protein n=1 Tax=Limtongia smithiae TaxID=1125753 RepID=UPI0034CDD4DF
MTARGKLILIEGLDRAGKTTQCALLRERLEAECGVDNVIVQKLPDRTTNIGKTINSYLSCGTELDDRAVHLLFSANRWELRSFLLDSLRGGKTIILDRYVPSGVAYSLAKEIPGMSLEWCLAPERGLPVPDVTIFLDINPANADVLSSREGFGIERYELSEFQSAVRSKFKTLLGDSTIAGVLKWDNVVTVDATNDINTVAETISKAIEEVSDLDEDVKCIE